MDKLQEIIAYTENVSDNQLMAIAIGLLSIILSVLLSSRIARFIEEAGFDQILQPNSTAHKSSEKSLFRNIRISSLYRGLISFSILAFGISLILQIVGKEGMGIKLMNGITPLAAIMVIGFVLLAAWHWTMQRIHTFVNAEPVTDFINQFAGDRSRVSHWNSLTELILRTLAQALFLIIALTLAAEVSGFDSVGTLLMAFIGFLTKILSVVLIGLIGWISIRVLRNSGKEKENINDPDSLNERTVEIFIIAGIAAIAALSLITEPIRIFPTLLLIAAAIFIIANWHRYPDFKAGLELASHQNKPVKISEGTGKLTRPGVFRSIVRIGGQNHEVFNSQIELAKKRSSKDKSENASPTEQPAQVTEQTAPKAADQE